MSDREVIVEKIECPYCKGTQVLAEYDAITFEFVVNHDCIACEDGYLYSYRLKGEEGVDR